MQQSGSARWPSSRGRASISCVVCRQKKKKCSQGQPCRRCARTYPPVECVYIPIKAVEQTESTASVFGSGSSRHFPVSDVETGSSYGSVVSTPSLSSTLGSSKDSVALTRRADSVISRSPDYLLNKGLEIKPDLQGEDGDVEELGYPRLEHSSGAISASARREQDVWGSIPMSLRFTAFDLLRLQDVAPTPENATHISLHGTVVTMSCSLDGSEPKPNQFTKLWFSGSASSPLLLRVAILNGAYFRTKASQVLWSSRRLSAEELKVEVYNSTVHLAAQTTELISLLNEDLRRSHLSDGAFGTVFAFIYFDLHGGEYESLRIHTNGLRQMVNVRGGLDNLGMDGLLKHMIVLQHCQVSIITEIEPYPELVEDMQMVPMRSPFSDSLRFASPLVSREGTFTTYAHFWDIDQPTAQILDDMSYILSNINTYILGTTPPTNHSTFLANVQRIQARLETIPIEPTDDVFTTILLTARHYTTTVLTRKVISQTHPMPLVDQLLLAVSRISLGRWAQLPGVFIWMTLYLTTSVKTDEQPAWYYLRATQGSCSFGMALDDWDTAMKAMGTFINLQRWIRGAGYEGHANLVLDIPMPTPAPVPVSNLEASTGHREADAEGEIRGIAEAELEAEAARSRKRAHSRGTTFGNLAMRLVQEDWSQGSISNVVGDKGTGPGIDTDITTDTGTHIS